MPFSSVCLGKKTFFENNKSDFFSKTIEPNVYAKNMFFYEKVTNNCLLWDKINVNDTRKQAENAQNNLTIYLKEDWWYSD